MCLIYVIIIPTNKYYTPGNAAPALLISPSADRGRIKDGQPETPKKI